MTHRQVMCARESAEQLGGYLLSSTPPAKLWHCAQVILTESAVVCGLGMGYPKTTVAERTARRAAGIEASFRSGSIKGCSAGDAWRSK